MFGRNRNCFVRYLVQKIWNFLNFFKFFYWVFNTFSTITVLRTRSGQDSNSGFYWCRVILAMQYWASSSHRSQTSSVDLYTPCKQGGGGVIMRPHKPHQLMVLAFQLQPSYSSSLPIVAGITGESQFSQPIAGRIIFLNARQDSVNFSIQIT